MYDNVMEDNYLATETAGLTSKSTTKFRVNGILDGTRPRVAQTFQKYLPSKKRKDNALRYPLQTPNSRQKQQSKEKLTQRNVVSKTIKGAHPYRYGTSTKKGLPTSSGRKATAGSQKSDAWDMDSQSSSSTMPVPENRPARSQKATIASVYGSQVGGRTQENATAPPPFRRTSTDEIHPTREKRHNTLGRTLEKAGAQPLWHKKNPDQHPTREKIHGSIVKVSGNAAYIKPFDSLPPDYNPNIYVSFPANKAMSGYVPIQEGDEVDFTLGTKDKRRPAAFNVRLVRATRRSAHTWQKYLTKLTSILVSSDVTNLGESGAFYSPRNVVSIEDIIVNVLACTPVWEEVGQCNDLGKNDINLLLCTLLELYKRTGSMTMNFDRVLRIIVSSNLFCSHSGPFNTFIVDAFKHESQDEELLLVQRFLMVVVKRIPEKARFVVTLIKPMLKREPLSKATIVFLHDMLKQAAAFLSDSIYDMAWDEVPLVPPMKELLSGSPEHPIHLQRVKTSGPYASYEEYIETYFRLLRADCHTALKTGVHSLLSGDLDHRDMNVYRNIELQGIRLAFWGGVSLVVKLAPDTTKRLLQPGRLMVGNLLCISIDGSFRDAIWATVSNVDLLKAQKIVLFDLSTDNNTLSDAEVVMALSRAGTRPIMVESPTYFKAYQPVLKALQSMHPLTDRFKDVLVKVQEPSHPEYVNIDTEMNVLKARRRAYHSYYDQSQSTANTTRRWACASDEELSQGSVISDDDQSQSTQNSDVSQSQSGVNVLEYARSPSMIMPDTLDESQEAAVKHALSHSVALIEGPPGTGKTYIGVKLVELILSMTTAPSTPILVLTYKNHALDEFLKEVISVTSRLIRVGGRSQEPILERYNLKSVKKDVGMSQSLHEQLRSYGEDKDVQKRHVEDSLHSFKESKKFSVWSFVDYLTTDALKLFLATCDWRKTNVRPFQRKIRGNDGYVQVQSKRRKIDKTEVVDFLAQLPLGDENKFKYPYQRNQLSTLLYAAQNLWLPAQEVFQRLDTNSEIPVQQTSKIGASTVKVEPSEDKEEEGEIAEEERRNLAADYAETDKEDIQKLLNEIHFFTEKKPSTENFIPELSNHIMGLDSQVTAPVHVEGLWGLTNERRVRLVHQMMLKSSQKAACELKEALTEYQRICTMKKEIEEQHKTNILKDTQIIGMTITGASDHHHYLEQVRPAVVIVEEAAEVLEPQLLAVMGDWVQHLILIGDHKQLRPPVETYTLARDYSFDVSMMERLILNDLPHATLAMQNRMRPEFAELLLDIYPKLKSNLSRVEKNQPAECIEQSMFFWDHVDPETADRSYTNEGEADRAVRLALFLIQHGYAPTTITILAAYRGQTALIRRKIREAQTEYPNLFYYYVDKYGKPTDPNAKTDPNTIKSYTIDMYQGDENDFLIVSLVRSNPQKKIGFLKVLNRRCVAQSRARRGMYFIGNKEVLMVDHNWRGLINRLQEKECVSSILPLRCSKHPTLSKLKVEAASDITLEAFCTLTCPELMACGKHRCPAHCPPNHDHMKCNQRFPFVHERCGHEDARACWQSGQDIDCKRKCPELMNCGKHPCERKCDPMHTHYVCKAKVEFVHAKCGHSGIKQCHEIESGQRCIKEVSMIFPFCHHPGMKKCFQKDGDKTCLSPCPKQLPCGHVCPLVCGEPCIPENCPDCARIRNIDAQKRREAEEKRREIIQLDTKRRLNELEKSRYRKPTYRNLSSTSDGASEYFDVEDKVKNYVQAGQNWFPNVTKIDKLINFELEKWWLVAKLHLYDANMRSELKFFGASDKDITGISYCGFRMPTFPGTYGQGIYFASHSMKSTEDRPSNRSHVLLLCDVLLGKSKTVENPTRGMTWDILRSEGYDSVFSKRGRMVLYDEFVIYRPEQALPKYVIHYEKSDLEAPSLVQLDPLQRIALSARPLEKFTIEPKRQFDLADPLDVHFRIVESQFLRVMTHANASYTIKRVDYYVNASLTNRFEAKQRYFQREYGTGVEAQPLMAFPGDQVESHIDRIVKENFQPDGDGINFSEFSDISSSDQDIRKLLLCRILPGQCSDERPRLAYDLHRVRRDQRGRGKVWVIRDSDQILPCYVIHYGRRQ